MYPTNRQIAEMPNTSRQAMMTRYGEGLLELRAHRQTIKDIRRLMDRAEHCCYECEDLDARYIE